MAAALRSGDCAYRDTTMPCEAAVLIANLGGSGMRHMGAGKEGPVGRCGQQSRPAGRYRAHPTRYVS
jgi:hypothetical protein